MDGFFLGKGGKIEGMLGEGETNLEAIGESQQLPGCPNEVSDLERLESCLHISATLDEGTTSSGQGMVSQRGNKVLTTEWYDYKSYLMQMCIKGKLHLQVPKLF